jgi:hypothetical protein
MTERVPRLTESPAILAIGRQKRHCRRLDAAEWFVFETTSAISNNQSEP